MSINTFNDPSKKIRKQIFRQNLTLLVQLIFQNYSKLKQKLDEEDLYFIGEERFPLAIVKGILKNINSKFLNPLNYQSDLDISLLFDEEEL